LAGGTGSSTARVLNSGTLGSPYSPRCRPKNLRSSWYYLLSPCRCVLSQFCHLKARYFHKLKLTQRYAARESLVCYTNESGSCVQKVYSAKLIQGERASVAVFEVVEAAGVELIRVLTTRKLLILGTATTARKAPLPNPLYVYCTKMLFALESNRHT
jgi:hypothetical protein